VKLGRRIVAEAFGGVALRGFVDIQTNPLLPLATFCVVISVLPIYCVH
jgi:hypothetical protein